jgi:hypothetical protein
VSALSGSAGLEVLVPKEGILPQGHSTMILFVDISESRMPPPLWNTHFDTINR